VRFVPSGALRAFLICLLASGGVCSQSRTSSGSRNLSSAETPQKSPAEVVFASAASKVVYLITRKAGEVYARASGVVLTADGYIATNYHALQGADAVEIQFFPDPADTANYQSFNGARLLYADARRDIAVLKVNSKTLPFLECLVTGCDARVGETVYAIGNPMGLSNTISQGIVSALRSVESEEIVQHTAAISPGSSGGALVDSTGALLGMNSWQVADAQNLNFAISAKHVWEALQTARHSTIALSFPPETPADDASSPEERAWLALQLRDYIQAANQAEQAVANGVSNSKLYMVLGKADIELGKKQEAERYIRQALLLAGPDDKFKQGARYYLLTILAGRFGPGTNATDRLAIIRLVNDFLASNVGSIEDPADYNKMREWAASLPGQVRSIVGTWWEGIPSTLLNGSVCATDYTFSRSSTGQFKLDTGFLMPFATMGVSCRLHGTIEPRGDGFVGEITREVILDPSTLGIGAAEQELRIDFRMSDDLQTIEGTASGGPITRGKFQSKYAERVLSFPPGPTGSWHFTMQRQQ